MNSVFYVAAIIAVLASFKVVIATKSKSALAYLVLSLFATAIVFLSINAYFAAVLEIMFFLGVIVLLFWTILTRLHLNKDTVEQNKHGISPKIWLGPFILSFILLVTLLYGIASARMTGQYVKSISIMSNIPWGSYLIVLIFSVILLLTALVIAVHLVVHALNGDKLRSKAGSKGKGISDVIVNPLNPIKK